MVVSLRHSFVSPKIDGPDVTLVQPSNWNDEHVLTQATARLLGRTTTGTGPTEEISVGARLSFSGGVLNGAASPTYDGLTTGALTVTGTGAVKVATGTTGERPTPLVGHFRFNTTTSRFEGYNGAAWGAVGGGATGGGSDEIFIENGQTVTTNYTVTAGRNAMTAGPITINAGVTVTVPSGSRWVVV